MPSPTASIAAPADDAGANELPVVGPPGEQAVSLGKRSSTEGARIWESLTRVQGLKLDVFTPEHLNVASLKLDGRRVALCCRRGRVFCADALAVVDLDLTLAYEDFVLDTEEQAGTYWAFDALMVDGLDIRGLALGDRLRLLWRLCQRLRREGLLAAVQPKAYVSLQSPDHFKELLRGPRQRASDGIILAALQKVYEAPAYKFKATLTVDFGLETADGPPGRYCLLTQHRGRLKVYRERGRPCYISLRKEERVKLQLPDVLHRDDGVIVECLLPATARGRWHALRRRVDRSRPNCLQTVLDTLAVKRDRLDCEHTLLRALRPVGAKDAFLHWRDILARRLLWCLGDALQTQAPDLLLPVVTGEDAPILFRASTGGDVPAAKLEDLQPLVIWAAFDASDAAAQRLLQEAGRLQRARLSFRLLLLFQTCAEPEAWKNLSYFGVLLRSDAWQVQQWCLDAGIERATLLSLEPGGADPLLRLPVHLQRLAAVSYALCICIEEGRALFSPTLEKLYESVSVA